MIYSWREDNEVGFRNGDNVGVRLRLTPTYRAGALPENTGGGLMRVETPKRSIWDIILGRPSVQKIYITIDPKSTVQFTDIHGKSFRPDTVRILSHELGEAYPRMRGGLTTDSQVIRLENDMSIQRNPNAPIRAISDHNNWLSILTK
ncbi:MAG: hypothetical protein FWC38_03395 [Proteobacteria bacterium]|nr:hypothetical protein [Pseudomonadota bacterium]MCL2307273.1 hypothetical protein [Pseudomonadota bacterium]